MNVGSRVARLRVVHGESLREAAARTGVSHSTIARIEKGEVTVSFHQTLRKIAKGYAVPLDFLFTGEHLPGGQTRGKARRLSPEERSSLLFASGRDRMRRAFAMVTVPQQGSLTREQFATALGTDLNTLEKALAGWGDLPAGLVDPLCDQLALLTGLSPLWFRWGRADEATEPPVAGGWALYMRLVEKSCEAKLQPDLVDMAIDLLQLNGGTVAMI